MHHKLYELLTVYFLWKAIELDFIPWFSLTFNLSLVSQSQHSQMLARGTQHDQGDQEESGWHLGSKKNPATTCKELGLMYPHLEDGEGKTVCFYLA